MTLQHKFYFEGKEQVRDSALGNQLVQEQLRESGSIYRHRGIVEHGGLTVLVQVPSRYKARVFAPSEVSHWVVSGFLGQWCNTLRCRCIRDIWCSWHIFSETRAKGAADAATYGLVHLPSCYPRLVRKKACTFPLAEAYRNTRRTAHPARNLTSPWFILSAAIAPSYPSKCITSTARWLSAELGPASPARFVGWASCFRCRCT